MIESFDIGGVQGDFMGREEFLALCRQRLARREFTHIVTLNPEMVMAAQYDAEFKTALASASWRIPDGAGLIWARWYVRSEFWSLWPSLLAFPFIQVERVTGVDAVRSLSKLAADANKRVYLLGGTPYQNTRTAKLLREEFPALAVETSPPHTFDIDGPAAILADIQQKKPDIIFVAYGAPAQTLWIERHRTELATVSLAIGVGGAFAILSEDTPRAPGFLRQLNLEWLWRLILEPTRLGRIWRATVQFPLLVDSQKKKVIHTPA
jgi:N-acetylglucosaminyldiphosphoundecaprenol N-acetyl-beta-D-mannosaminyltransferase